MQKKSFQASSFVQPAAIAVVVVLGFLSANALRWYCDDIFITLRYAENWLAGNGVVYNIGERVEGYSNFLWLLIITALQRLGLDPVETAINLGIVMYLGVLVIFAMVSHRLSGGRFALAVPLTSLALIANHESRVWASSGMETSFFMLLLAAAFFAFFFSGARRALRLVTASFFLVLAAMTRPDGLLIYVVAAALLLAGSIRFRRSLSRTAADITWFVVPLAALYLPYALWKISYYGDFFPNTYYAKSAGMPHFSQGFYYLWLYFRGHPSSIFFVLAVPALLLRYSGRDHTADRDKLRDAGSAVFVSLIVVAAYLVLFVARVGGGFMYARFIIPMLPFVYFVIEWSARRALAHRAEVLTVILACVPLFVTFVEGPIRNGLMLVEKNGKLSVRTHRGILDEHHYYTKGYPIKRDRRIGEYLRPHFEGLDATVILRGQACFGYYAGFKHCIDNTGLTDAEIAHKPLEKRGRIGHEKAPTRSWMMERGVDFIFSRPMLFKREYRVVYFMLPFTTVRAELITYDRELMQQLAKRMGPQLRFTPFEQALDHYIEHGLPKRTAPERLSDYEEFKFFYFDHTDDPDRERIVLEALPAAEGE